MFGQKQYQNNRNRTHSINRRTTNGVIKVRSHIHMTLCAALFLLLQLFTPTPGHTGYIGLYSHSFGANESVIAELGQVSYITGCPAGGIDDFIYPWANVYIVPQGSTALTDVSNAQGVPNTLQYIIVDEVLANTAPGGYLVSGDYAVIMDECQDGVFQPGVDFYGEQFSVRIPANIDPLQSAAFAAQLAATKSAATNMQIHWASTAKFYAGLFAVYDAITAISIATDPADFLLFACTNVVDNQGQIVSPYCSLTDAWAGLLTLEFNVLKYITNAAFYYKGIAADPADPNYTVLPVLEGGIPFDSSVTQPGLQAVLQYGELAAQEQALTSALLESMEKYQGAEQAGIGEYAYMQAKKVEEYARALAELAPRSAAAFQTVANEVNGSGIDYVSIMDDYRATQARVNSSGLTALEHAKLVAAGWAEQDITYGLTDYLSRDFSGLQTTSDLTNLASAMTADAAALQTALTSFADAMATEQANLAAQLRLPFPTAHAGGPYVTDEGSPLTLNGSGSSSPDLPNASLTFQWDLNMDGNFDDATGETPATVFNREFDGYIGLKVTAPNGYYDVGYARTTVNNVNSAPVITSVTPSASVISIPFNGSQSYTAAATDPDGDPVTYTWDVDGDVLGSGTSYTYTASMPGVGEHIVTVTVADDSPLSPDTRRFWRMTVVGTDNDSDGFPSNVDCNDNNPNVNPGMTEINYNGIDDDCNPLTPDDPDADNDGYLYTIDCNDNDPNIYPGAAEVCNGIDDNCNSQIDEGVTLTFYRDVDGDTYGDPAVTTQACTAPAGYVADNTDCNDANAAVHPGAAEIFYNGIDDDCNPATADGIDVDNDGYADNVDCNDADPTVNPGKKEIRHNGKDDDCDTATLDNWSKSFVIGIDDSSWIYYAKSNGDGTFSNYKTIWQLGGGNARGVVIEDFDGDGDLDFIAGRGIGSTAYFHLFINDGSDNFSDTGIVGTLPNAGGYAMDMAAGDFNNDGRMDFVAGADSSNSGIYLNDGQGGFTQTVFTIPGGNRGRGIDVADFNTDGNPDFAMGTCCSGEVRVYSGDGTGNFTSAKIGNVGSDLYALAAADFDNDGKADFITGGSGDGNPYFFKGNGDGTFQAPVAVPSLDTNYYNAIDAYDLNNDGKVDVVLSDYASSFSIWFYPGNGDGTFGAGTKINTSNLRSPSIGISAPPTGNPAGFPIADAEPKTQTISVGGTANLNGTYSHDPDGTIASYAWKFGDGGTGTGGTVSHTYTSENRFAAALTVTDNDGKKDSDAAEVKVIGTPPVADAGGPYTMGEANASNGIYTVNFNGSGSSDDYGIVKYEWDPGDDFSDNFDDGVADGWTAYRGTWSVTGGSYQQTDINQDRTMTLAGNVKSGDYTVEADVMMVSGSGQEIQLLFRALDQNNRYEFILRGRGINDLLLYRVVNNSYAQLAGFGLPFAPQLDTLYHLKVEAYGSSIRCYLDGNLAIDASDTQFSSGKVGFSTYYTNAKFDNLTVKAVKTGVNPSHTYSAGAYTVTLTVTDSVGQTSTDTAQVISTPGAPPVSNPGGPYTFGESFANQGIWTATLNGTASTDDVAIESYLWDFGDGTTGTGAAPSHQYGTAGIYNIALTVTDRAGQSNTAMTTVSIEKGAPPIANPGGPYTVPETAVVNRHWTVNVDGSGSSDDVVIWKYEWNFGDGSPVVTTSSAAHTYVYPGTYTVTLKVTDNAGQTNTVNTTASVVGTAAPTANAGGPYILEKGLPVTLDGSGSTDDVGILSYSWDFGDGTTGAGTQPNHTYTSAGTYTVTLTVTDIALQTSSVTATVLVSIGNPPVADAGGPYSTNEDLPVRFDGSHSTDDYGIVSYEWSVGNLITHLSDTFSGTTIDSAKWLYPSSGVTQSDAVTLTGGGGWGSLYLFSQGDFTVDGTSILQGQIMQTAGGHLMFGFKNTNTNYSYAEMPYAFYFASGAIQIYESGNYRGQFGSYSFDTPYDVKIVLKGAPGSAPTGAKYYYKPATSSTWTLVYDSSYAPGYSSMKAGYSYYSGTFIIDNTSLVSGVPEMFGERPVGIFQQAGTYPVTLKVTDGSGQSHTASSTLTVSADPAVITVPWQFSGGIEVPHDTWSGEEVILKAVVKSRHEPLTYTWDFGDGTSTSGTVTNKYNVSARHTYTAASGTPFVAQLTVIDADGRTASDTFPIIVRQKSLDVEINKAIDDALWFVHTSQNRPNGWWISSGYDGSHYASPTASSIHSMEINGHLEIGDFSNDPYVEDVWSGMRYMLTTLRQNNIGDQAYGNPDVNGNGIGIDVSSSHPIYEGGPVMMALVASGTPDMAASEGGVGIVGRTYKDIVEDMAEMFYWGQGDDASGYGAGGWRYGWQAQGDNSACQWAALGMDAAEEQKWLNVPRWVKDRNEVWLAYSQAADGTFGYTGPGSFADGDIATTPSGLAQLAFDNVPTTDARWTLSENRMAQVWNSLYKGSGNYYALYALAKALRIARPNELIIIGGGTPNAIDWYNDPVSGVARTIVDQQDPNGQFVGGSGTKWVEGSFRAAWGVIILTKTLFVLPPVADAGDDRVWGVDWPLPFDGSRSYHLDPFRHIVLYEWDFDGDGIYDYSSTEPTATHTYAALGTYTVTLRVTDDNDPAKYDTDTMKVIVAVPPHAPVAVPGEPYTGTAGVPVQLNGSGSYDIDPTDTITFYGWELDGVFPYDFDDAFGPNPTVTFNAPGNYNVGLRVLDNGVLNDLNVNGQVDPNEKLEDIRWTTVNITANHAPVADAGGPYTVNEGSPVQLDGGGSSDPDSNPITYAWDLDNDGQYDDSTNVKPQFSWPDNGIYTVGLQVSDSSLTGTDTAVVTVLNVLPTVNAGADQTVNTGDTVSLAPATFTDPGVLDTHTATIDWGDGTVEAGAVTEASGNGSVSGSHIYATAGSFTVTVTVKDNDGGESSDTLNVTVSGAADNCPNDPNKTEPGICGCGIADTDSDGDGTADCNDQCPADPAKVVPGVCGCGIADTDSDGDGTADCQDQCPADPAKVAPGVCGCGIADTDSDGDGTADCNDQCPADPVKVVPGVCGCGIADTDSDGDGTADCQDQCPADPVKVVPGVCGCGIADTDSDGDGTADCQDQCPADPNKVVPGVCGCGIAETDCAIQPVTNLTARPKDRKIDIVWSHVGAKSYNVYRNAAGGAYLLIANTTSTYSTYADFGLTNGVKYCYKVRSVNATGNESVDSNIACAIPKRR